MWINNTIKTTTYNFSSNYLIDVVDDGEYYTAFLYHKNYGIKEMMFGLPKSQQSYEDALEIIEKNAPEYIIYYREEYDEDMIDLE